jgi:flagellar basal body-associated protein FliL
MMTTTMWVAAIVALAVFIAGQWTLFAWVFKRLYGDYQQTQDRLQKAHEAAVQQTEEGIRTMTDLRGGLGEVCAGLGQHSERTDKAHARLARSMQQVAKYQAETLKTVERINGKDGK